MKKCPKCGRLSDARFSFCNQCGTRLPDTQYCGRCGAETAPCMRFCTCCGAALEDSDSVKPKKGRSAAAAKLRQSVSHTASACKDTAKRLTHSARDATAQTAQKGKATVRHVQPAARKRYALFGGAACVVILAAVLLLTLSGRNTLCTATQTLNVDGVYVDTAFESSDGKMPIYIFLAVKATEDDISLYSKNVTLTFDDGSSYDSEFFSALNAHQEKYYYSDYVKHLYGGETGYLVLTVRVPMSRLDAAKSFTIEAQQVPDIEKLRIGTKDIVRLEGDEAICSQADPEGYAHNMTLREPAGEERAKAVEENLTGRYWIVSIANDTGTCRVSFEENRTFGVTLLGVTNSGTYDIREGYLYCSYDGHTYPLQIPYTLDEYGKVDLTFTNVL